MRRRELTLTPVGGAAEPCAARVRLFAGLDRAQLERISALARPRDAATPPPFDVDAT